MEHKIQRYIELIYGTYKIQSYMELIYGIYNIQRYMEHVYGTYKTQRYMELIKYKGKEFSRESAWEVPQAARFESYVRLIHLLPWVLLPFT